MSVPILPPDPTDALYPLDWAADGDLQPPTALQPRGFEPGVPLAAQHLGWVLRHIYYLLSVLFGGTLAERKVSVWPGLFPYYTSSATLVPLNRVNSGSDTFTQMLCFGIGQPARTLTTLFAVDRSTQLKIVAGDQGGGVIATGTRQSVMPGGKVTQLRVRFGDLGDLDPSAASLTVSLTGSDGLVRAWGPPDPIVANAWNVYTLAPVPDPIPSGAIDNPSDDTTIPGPIDVTVQVVAFQDSGSLGTEEVLMAVEEIEVTFGT